MEKITIYFFHGQTFFGVLLSFLYTWILIYNLINNIILVSLHFFENLIPKILFIPLHLNDLMSSWKFLCEFRCSFRLNSDLQSLYWHRNFLLFWWMLMCLFNLLVFLNFLLQYSHFLEFSAFCFDWAMGLLSWEENVKFECVLEMWLDRFILFKNSLLHPS